MWGSCAGGLGGGLGFSWKGGNVVIDAMIFCCYCFSFGNETPGVGMNGFAVCFRT